MKVSEFANMAPDKVPVMICCGDKFVLMGVPAGLLLPPSKLGPVKKGPDGENFRAFRDSFYLYYLTDEEYVEEAARPRLRRLQEAVRGAVAAKLAGKGLKRPLIDIVFEVIGGPGLKARARANGGLPTPTFTTPWTPSSRAERGARHQRRDHCRPHVS